MVARFAPFWRGQGRAFDIGLGPARRVRPAGGPVIVACVFVRPGNKLPFTKGSGPLKPQSQIAFLRGWQANCQGRTNATYPEKMVMTGKHKRRLEFLDKLGKDRDTHDANAPGRLASECFVHEKDIWIRVACHRFHVISVEVAGTVTGERL